MAQIKTAISLDKSLFEKTEILARRLKVSRSRLFAMALEDFLRRRQNEELLQQINSACDDSPDQAEAMRLTGMRRYHREMIKDEW